VQQDWDQGRISHRGSAVSSILLSAPPATNFPHTDQSVRFGALKGRLLQSHGSYVEVGSPTAADS
jgi:hypothetical protein